MRSEEQQLYQGRVATELPRVTIVRSGGSIGIQAVFVEERRGKVRHLSIDFLTRTRK
jgi:hypothetical protein